MTSVAKRTRSDSKTKQPSKRFKVDPSEIDGVESSKTTILDLNEDCLAEVFLHLSQHDLANVRLVSNHELFKYASERAFTRNFAKSQTIVSMFPDYHSNASSVIENSLRLLQAFGHLITKLLLKFKLENIAKLLKSIDENCGANIIELELCHLGVSVIEDQKHLYGSGLDEIKKFLDGGLHKRFPKLHHLKFEYRNTSKNCPYLKSLVHPIPSLKSFSVAGRLFALDDIREFIGLNVQLESLALFGRPDPNVMSCDITLNITEEFINYVDAALPQLKNVQICHINNKHSSYGRSPTNGFQNLMRLTIGDSADFQYSCFDAWRFAGKNTEEICAYFILHPYISFPPYTLAVILSRFKKLKRLVVHLMIGDEENPFLLEQLEQLRTIVSDSSQLKDVVIQLYRKDDYYNTVAYEDSSYLDLIKSAFNTAQWGMSEDANRLEFSKHHQN